MSSFTSRALIAASLAASAAATAKYMADLRQRTIASTQSYIRKGVARPDSGGIRYTTLNSASNSGTAYLESQKLLAAATPVRDKNRSLIADLNACRAKLGLEPVTQADPLSGCAVQASSVHPVDHVNCLAVANSQENSDIVKNQNALSQCNQDIEDRVGESANAYAEYLKIQAAASATQAESDKCTGIACRMPLPKEEAKRLEITKYTPVDKIKSRIRDLQDQLTRDQQTLKVCLAQKKAEETKFSDVALDSHKFQSAE